MIAAGIYANIGAGLLIGFCCLSLAKFLKCRNSLWVFTSVAIAVLTAMHAFSVSMVGSVLRSSNGSFNDSVLWRNPLLSLQMLWRWNGGLLIHESGLLIAFGYVWYLYRRQVYCETCQKWLDLTRTFLLLPMPHTPEAKAAFDSGDLEHVATHQEHQHLKLTVRPFVRLDYVLCNGCGNCGAYQLMLVFDREMKGQMHRDEKPMSHLMRLNEVSMRYLAVLIHANKRSSFADRTNPTTRFPSRTKRKIGIKPNVNSKP